MWYNIDTTGEQPERKEEIKMRNIVTKELRKLLHLEIECDYTPESDYETLRVEDEDGNVCEIEYARSMSYAELAREVKRAWNI